MCFKCRTGKCAALENSGERLRKALASILIALAGEQNEATLCLLRINCERLIVLPSALHNLEHVEPHGCLPGKTLLSKIFRSREYFRGSRITLLRMTN